jgi:hypothetical protein
MSGPDPRLARDVRIELVRKAVRATVRGCELGGATPQESAIGSVYGLFDVAERFAGEGVAAIEWLRTTLDVLEAGIMAGKVRRG